MTMKRAITLVFALLVLVVAIDPAAAQDNKFKIFAAASYVSPLSDDDVTVDDVTEAVEASSEIGWNIGFEWRWSELLGLEIDYLDAQHDVEVGGVVVGEVGMSPLSASLNIHLIQTKLIDFYVAPTISYVNWGDVELNELGDNETVSTDTETAYGVSLGLDIGLGENLAIVTGLRYLRLDVTPEDSDGISVDPLFARVGLAWRF
jgi:opacity protein-like surface antigen